MSTQQPLAWWLDQARPYHHQTCPKCGHGTNANFVWAHSIYRECGIVEGCCMCGWERVHLWGVEQIPMGVPC